MMNKIHSIKNALIVAARQLNKPAERLQHFLLEGEDAIAWALSFNTTIEHVFLCSGYANKTSWRNGNGKLP